MESQDPFEEIYCPALDYLDSNISSAEYLQAYHYANNPPTYFKNGELQCTENRRRSLIDLYSLLKTKYPNYTYTKLGEDLYYLREYTLSRPIDNQRGFMIFVCHNINRIVVSNRYHWMPTEWISLSSYELVLFECRDTIQDPEYHTLVKNLIAIQDNKVSPEILIGIIAEKSFQPTLLTEK